ncbi:MAG TPA: hypothetical protein VEJ87_01905 [Acidimicrobiales bacterium]|nr:hypothetical protein [Acidimicrobiales bacterium]
MTTTVTHPTSSASSGTSPWVWAVIAVVLAAAVVALIVFIVRRRARLRADKNWRPGALAALDDARLAQQLMAGARPETDDAEHRAAVSLRVEQAAQALDRSSAAAPDDEARRETRAAADALRGTMFSLEADRLLRDGVHAPSAEQLAQADQARRSRAAELDSALSALAQRLGRSSADTKGT